MKYYTITYQIFDSDLWCWYEDKKSFIAKDKQDAIRQLKHECGIHIQVLSIKEEL